MRLALLLVLVSGVLAASAASEASSNATAKNWTGIAVGGFVSSRHFESRDRSFVGDIRHVRKARFTFTFQISPSGAITGSGRGRFLTATSHWQGTSDGAPFACDVPSRTKPFTVLVGGRASGGRITLRLELPDATVTNDNVDCGADVTVTATVSRRLDESLEKVGGRKLSFSMQNTRIPVLRKREDFFEDDRTGDPVTRDHVVRNHEWRFTIKQP